LKFGGAVSLTENFSDLFWGKCQILGGQLSSLATSAVFVVQKSIFSLKIPTLFPFLQISATFFGKMPNSGGGDNYIGRPP